MDMNFTTRSVISCNEEEEEEGRGASFSLNDSMTSSRRLKQNGSVVIRAGKLMA